MSLISLEELPEWLLVQNLPANAGDAEDVSQNPGMGRAPGGENCNPSSILAWEIPWTEEPGVLQCMGTHSQMQLSTHVHTYYIRDACKICEYSVQQGDWIYESVVQGSGLRL